MNLLPPEIWREIFSYACIDGGYTGTSLSLACKFFHNISLPVRFHVVSFHSLRQVELFLAFASRYQQEHHGTIPRVYHLLLSFSRAQPPSFPSSLDATDVTPHSSPRRSPDVDQWIIARRLREQDKATWDHRFLALVSGLLDLAAPHLRTLALLQSDGFTLPAIRRSLPRVRELTLLVGISVMLNGSEGDTLIHYAADSLGASPPSSPLSHPSRKTGAPTFTTPNIPHARFPALERLHVVCGRHRDFVLRDTLAHLPRLAPMLTHLRISNATYTHEHCIPGFLHDALGMPLPAAAVHPAPPRPAEDGAKPVSRLPQPCLDAKTDEGADVHVDVRPALPALRRVIVHSVPPPSTGTCGNPQREYVVLVNAVNALRAACDLTSDVRVRAMRGERAKHRVWERVVESHWSDRIGGGYGCWVGRDEPSVRT
ncbi:hypothetical protein C8Q79DRAFT_1111321 [Trametes meyenii]|nr:hypothetical protein C8Q79DRAFT_1111321 [Trametes meyenii]